MKTKWFSTVGMGLVLACAVLMFTGCQSDINGQTLPSGNYLNDDVQYFQPGLEHRAPREAAALNQAYAEQKQQQNMSPY